MITHIHYATIYCYSTRIVTTVKYGYKLTLKSEHWDTLIPTITNKHVIIAWVLVKSYNSNR